MRPVLIDCDPGSDDALAIFAALNSPDLDVVGLTTVGGNATIDDTTRNALALLEIAGRAEVPVWRGAGRPLAGEFRFGYDYHGEAGMGIRLEAPTTREQPEPAVDAIIRAVLVRPRELTLIALGPLTNVALALRREPRLAEETAEVIVMGGAVEVPGNVTDHAEFNIYNDPAAAEVVFDSGAPVALVGLDVTMEVALSRVDKPWVEGDSATATQARQILGAWFELHPDRDPYGLHDPLAVAAAIDPTLLSCRQGTIGVEVRAGERLGKTAASYGPGPVRVALGVDAGKAVSMITGLIRA